MSYTTSNIHIVYDVVYYIVYTHRTRCLTYTMSVIGPAPNRLIRLSIDHSVGLDSVTGKAVEEEEAIQRAPSMSIMQDWEVLIECLS